jgi:RNA polymerase-binding transcription factor DksA
MDKKFIEEQKKKLLEEKAEMEKLLSSFARKETPSSWETKFPNFGEDTSEQDESADEVEEFSNLLNAEKRLEIKLSDINRALKKIEEGTYGLCEKNGEEIDKDRLRAIPETRYCSKHAN